MVESVKREVYAAREHVESAIKELARFNHPLLNEIIQRDLNEAKSSLEYIESIT